MSDLRLRPATPADADALAANLVDGVAVYRDFTPPGWRAPDLDAERERMRAWLARDDFWCLVADAGDHLAGNVGFVPAATATAHPVADSALAHLGQLFVRAPWQGTGLAARLLGAAKEEAATRGFVAMRLFVAAGYARGRRFYEREGFAPAAAPFFEPALDLEIVEYRGALAPPPLSRPAP